MRANADRANAARGAAPRNRVLVVLDIVAAVLLSFILLGIAIAVAGSATQYAGAHATCTPAQVDGLTCNGTVLGIITVVLTSVAIFGFVIAAGMVIVNIIRRRWTFWWPLGACVVMTGVFWLGTWIVGMTLPAVGPAS
jgi:hypothetical protein